MALVIRTEKFVHADGETKWEREKHVKYGPPGLTRVSLFDTETCEVFNPVDFRNGLDAEAYVCGLRCMYNRKTEEEWLKEKQNNEEKNDRNKQA